MSETTNLNLGLIDDGSRQGRVTYNEAMTLLDHIVYKAITAKTVTAQPASPTEGALYIIPAAATGAAWATFAEDDLAYYTNGAWCNVTPKTGWGPFKCTEDGLSYIYDGANWVLSASYYSGDHGLLYGLADDDHSQYLYKTPAAGVSRNVITLPVSGSPASMGLILSGVGTNAIHHLGFEDAAQISGNRNWGFHILSASNNFEGICASDSWTTYTPWLTVSRSGSTPSNVDFPNGSLTSGSYFQSRVDGSGGGYKAGSTGDVALYRSGAVRWQTVGSFGIGIDPANYPFQVHKASSSYNAIQITNTDTGTTATDGVLLGFDANEVAYLWNGENTNFEFYINSALKATLTTGGQFQLPTTGSGGGIDISGRTLYEDASSRLHTNSTFVTDGKFQAESSAGTAFDIFQSYDSGAALNEKYWRIQSGNSAWQFQTVDDAYTTPTTWFSATRSGNTISKVTFPNGIVTVGTPPAVTAGRFQVSQSTDTVTSGIAVVDTAQNDALYLWNDGTNANIYSSSDGSRNILLNGAGTGKVGIGTLSPPNKLTLNIAGNAGSITAAEGNAALRIQDTNSGVGYRHGIVWSKGDALSTTVAAIEPYVNSEWATDLYFYGGTASGPSSYPMVLKSTGSLEIAATMDSASIPTTAASYGLVLKKTTNTTNNYGAGIGVLDGSIIPAGITFVDEGASGATGIGIFTGNASAVTERIRINSTGNITTSANRFVSAGITDENNHGFRLADASEQWNLSTDTSHNLRFNHYSASWNNRLTLTNGGNLLAQGLGVNQSSPQTIAHIGGALTFDEMADPSDPSEGDGVIWIDTSGNLKYKTRQGGVVTAKTVATIP